MTIQFRAALAGDSGSTGSTTQVVTLPTGWQAGDFCVIAGRIGNSSVTFTTPSGWTIINTGGNSSGGYSYCFYYRVLQAGDSNPTFTASVSSTWNWESLGLYSDVGAALSFDAQGTETDTTTGGSTFTPPAATASGSGEASVIVMVGRSTTQVSPTGSSTTPASGWTTGASDAALLNANGNTRVGANYYQLGVSGTVTPGSFTFTLTGVTTSLDFSSQQVLVAEASGAGAPSLPQPGSPGWQRRYRRRQAYWATELYAAAAPQVFVPVFLRDRQAPAVPSRARNVLVTVPQPPPVYVTRIVPARRPAPRQPPQRLLTGMLPGKGLSGIPPSGYVRARLVRLTVRPRGTITGPLAPGVVAVVTPIRPVVLISPRRGPPLKPAQRITRGERGSLTVPVPVPVVLRHRARIRPVPQKLNPPPFVPAGVVYQAVIQQTRLVKPVWRLVRQPAQRISTGMLPGKGLSGIPPSAFISPHAARLVRQPAQRLVRGERGSLTVPVPVPVVLRHRARIKPVVSRAVVAPFVPAVVFTPMPQRTQFARPLYRLVRRPPGLLRTGMLPVPPPTAPTIGEVTTAVTDPRDGTTNITDLKVTTTGVTDPRDGTTVVTDPRDGTTGVTDPRDGTTRVSQ